MKDKEPDLSQVNAEERVFLHVDEEEKMWLVRPADNKFIELKYSDPILQPSKIGDKWVIVVDSKSQEEGSKPKYTEHLLSGKKAKDVSDEKLLEECQKSGPYFLTTLSSMISMSLVQDMQIRSF